jgi:nitrogenase subunit NifH
MTAITIYPNTKEEENLYKQLAQRLNNKFKTIESDFYSEELEVLINQARLEKEKGELVTVNPKDVWSSIP